MKLQFEGQKLRLRIDEDELAGLLAGASVRAHTRVADAFEMACTVRLSEASDASIEGAVGDWFVHLPQALVSELAMRLPTRDSLSFEVAARDVAGDLSLQFDVDVRDSARRLKASRNAHAS
jgi:hypothetical protein